MPWREMQYHCGVRLECDHELREVAGSDQRTDTSLKEEEEKFAGALDTAHGVRGRTQLELSINIDGSTLFGYRSGQQPDTRCRVHPRRAGRLCTPKTPAVGPPRRRARPPDRRRENSLPPAVSVRPETLEKKNSVFLSEC